MTTQSPESLPPPQWRTLKEKIQNGQDPEFIGVDKSALQRVQEVLEQVAQEVQTLPPPEGAVARIQTDIGYLKKWQENNGGNFRQEGNLLPKNPYKNIYGDGFLSYFTLTSTKYDHQDTVASIICRRLGVDFGKVTSLQDLFRQRGVFTSRHHRLDFPDKNSWCRIRHSVSPFYSK